MRKFSASSPASPRATRPLSVTSPRSKASSAGSSTVRSRPLPSSVRLKAPLSGSIVPSAISVSPPVRSRPARSENGAIELVSICTPPSNTRSWMVPASATASASPSSRSSASWIGWPASQSPATPKPMASPSAACVALSGAKMPASVPSPLKVTRRVAGSSRLAATPFALSVNVSAVSASVPNPAIETVAVHSSPAPVP